MNNNEFNEFDNNDIPQANEADSKVSFSNYDAPEGTINGKEPKDGTSSFITGLVFLLLSCGNFALAWFLGRYFIAWLFAIGPIVGIVSGVKAFKLDGSQKVLGILGIALNVLAMLSSILLIALELLAKFM